MTFFFSLLCSSILQAATTELVLGKVQVGDRTDKEVIHLPMCDGTRNIKVNSIQIKVKKKPVQVDRLKVVFHNGEQQILSVKKHFKSDQSSRFIDLDGQARCIKKIVFIGDADTKKRNSKKTSTIVVVGKLKHGNNFDDDVQNVTSTASQVRRLGAVKLGEETERDSIYLLPCSKSDNAKVSQLQISVKDHPVEINRVKIKFYNGPEQVFTVNRHLKVGETSPWVDLKGEKRCIEKITFVGDADTIGYKPGKQSKVVVKGK